MDEVADEKVKRIDRQLSEGQEPVPVGRPQRSRIGGLLTNPMLFIASDPQTAFSRKFVSVDR